MKKIIPFLLISSMVLFVGCASKRFAKKGLKYEEAGMYELAADMFYQSMVRNPKNIDAAIGLKKNGQRLLDDKTLVVHQAYSSGDDKETVYKFLEAKAYRDKVNATGVKISFPDRTEVYYNEARPRYLGKLYNEARLLLDEEKFKDSEQLFAEIKSIDPSYQGVDEHMKISKCEPIYREGIDFLSTGLYRKAYANFSNIITNHGSYKDSKELRDDALAKGLITIEVKPVTSKQRLNPIIATLAESKIKSAITSLNNPFVKLIDTKNTQEFLQQQNKGTNVQVGQILAAKAILSGTLIRSQQSDGELKKTEKRGYLKDVQKIKDPSTGEIKEQIKYTKVSYLEYEKENLSEVSFQFQLSSTETGSVLVSDAMDISETDHIHYAVFEGDRQKLVPGYWEYKDKTSPKDKVNDNTSEVNELQSLLNANKNIKSTETLQNIVFDKVAERIAGKINQYNPEK